MNLMSVIALPVSHLLSTFRQSLTLLSVNSINSLFNTAQVPRTNNSWRNTTQQSFGWWSNLLALCICYIQYVCCTFSLLVCMHCGRLTLEVTILIRSLLPFWALKVRFHCCLCWSAFNQKYLYNLCSNHERKSYGFGTTRGWVINDWLFILGWTLALNRLQHRILTKPNPTINHIKHCIVEKCI